MSLEVRPSPALGSSWWRARDGDGDALVTIEGPALPPHSLGVRDGRVRGWAEGGAVDPDALIRFEEAGDLEAFLAGTPMDQAAIHRIWVRHRERADAPGHRPLPLDEFELPGMRSLPPIPAADLVMVLVLPESPFGTLVATIRYESGIRTRWWWGELDAHQVRVTVPYRRYCEFRAGTLTALEALLFGTIDGEWSDLMLCDGLIEREEALREASAGCSPRAARALGVLGSLMGTADG